MVKSLYTLADMEEDIPIFLQLVDFIKWEVNLGLYTSAEMKEYLMSSLFFLKQALFSRFGQVGNQVSQVKDQVGQGQELDNIPTYFL